MSLEKPRIFKTPFAGAANPTTINTIPDIPNPDDIAQKPSLAAYSTGFPPRSMAPPQAGGQPFYGQDVNGILRDISANTQYVQAGNYYPFDADFQTAVGGYNKFAVVLNPTDGMLYQSLVDANTAPLSDTKSWFFFTDGKYLPLQGGGIVNGNVNINGNLIVSQGISSRGTNQNAVGTFYLDGRKTASDPYTGYLLRSFDNNFEIYTSSNSTAAKKVATYNATTDTWDFNTVGLTKNGVPVSTVQTEYWYVGGSESEPLIVESNKSYLFPNPYGGIPSIYIPQIYIDKNNSADGKSRWVEINGRFDVYDLSNDGLSFKTADSVADDAVTYEVGIRTGTNYIVASGYRTIQIPSDWIKGNLSSAKFRVKVMNLM